jgi:pyruvate kinase
MDYEIVVTLGPSSNAESVWRDLLAAGATGFRLNTSHLSVPELRVWIDRLGTCLRPLDPRPPLVLDLQGSKWRVGQFPAREVVPGQCLALVCEDATERPDVLPVPHPDFFRAASVSSGEIVLDDAKIRLALATAGGDVLSARVIAGGTILPRKGITYTASTYRRESLTETDRTILELTTGFPGILYALSYVRDALEMAHYRAHIGAAAHLIAKLERRPALDEATQIAESADELWLCRGDLGAELGAKAMAEAVHRFSRGVHAMPVPVLLAGQVFEHMTKHAIPTRSELCGAYDTLMTGYRGFVLSDETAIGRNPVESCRMAALVRE